MSTRYNTGNPIESTDVRDMSDNAKNFDEFSVSTQPTFSDRLGVERKTLPSLISQAEQDIYYAVINAGFQPAQFDFVTGGTLVDGERNKAVFNPSPTGDNNWYAWQGAFPKIISPNSTPSTSGGLGDNAWKPVTNNILAPTVMESIRRSYAEAGYNLVDGSFEAGGTLTTATDVLLYEVEGKAYSYSGTLPHIVAAGSRPSAEPGMWTDRSTAPNAFKQSGTGAVLLPAQSKLQEAYPSVTDYGADGTGDDTAAFTLAQAAHPFIEIPAGMHFTVSSGLNYWQFFGRGTVSESGKQWSLTPYPQTDSLGKHYVERTFGIYEQAVGQSITINSGVGQTKENTQVLGTDTKGLAQDYTDRDHVAQYISSSSYVPDVVDTTTTYTATSLTNSAITALNAAGKIKPGMVIDTLHATICTGRVQSVSGNTITVDVWWPRVGAAPVTPSNGTGAIINPNNKIFGQNIVVRSSGDGTTTGSIKFSGVELDLFTPPSASPVSGTWGYDMAVLGGYLDVGYQIRGKRNISFFSNNAGSGGLFGFRSVGDSRAVSIEDATSKAIEVVTGGSNRFSVDPDGTMSIVGGKVNFIGELQTTGTFTSIGLPWAIGHGALYYITGFNPGTGQEGKFLIAANNTGVGSVYSSDGSGATVSFQVSGNTLQIRSTTGVYQFTAFQLLI